MIIDLVCLVFLSSNNARKFRKNQGRSIWIFLIFFGYLSIPKRLWKILMFYWLIIALFFKTKMLLWQG